MSSFSQLFFSKPFQFLAKKKKRSHDFFTSCGSFLNRLWGGFLCRRRNVLTPLNLPLCFPLSPFNENESLLLCCQDWAIEKWSELQLQSQQMHNIPSSVIKQGSNFSERCSQTWQNTPVALTFHIITTPMKCQQQAQIHTSYIHINTHTQQWSGLHRLLTYSLARWSRWSSFSWRAWRSLKWDRETREDTFKSR